MVKSQPERGCAFWNREPGSDDEPLSTEQMRETWKHLAWPAGAPSGRRGYCTPDIGFAAPQVFGRDQGTG